MGRYTCARCLHVFRDKADHGRHAVRRTPCLPAPAFVSGPLPADRMLTVDMHEAAPPPPSRPPQVAVLPVGSEDTSRIDTLPYPRLKRLLNLEPEPDSVVRMVLAVHFDPKTPQNANVRLSPDSPGGALVYRRDGATRRCRWAATTLQDAVATLVSSGIVKFYDVEHTLHDRDGYADLRDYLDRLESANDGADADPGLAEDVAIIGGELRAALATRAHKGAARRVRATP